MNLSFFHKLADYICKDTGSKNESPKLIIVIRVLLLTMLFYVTINSIIYIRILNNTGFTISLVSFAFFLGMFFLSYHQKSFTIVFAQNIGMLIWILVNVTYFGWDVGVQYFILVLLVLCFFSGYSQYKFKFAYAVFLCAFRIYLYFHSKQSPAIVTLDVSMNHTLQIINTIFIFWSVAVTAYIFSKDSQTLEGKLIEYNTQLIS